MLLEFGGNLAKLLIHRGHIVLKLDDRLGRPDAGHDVFTLSVRQIFSIKHFLSG